MAVICLQTFADDNFEAERFNSDLLYFKPTSKKRRLLLEDTTTNLENSVALWSSGQDLMLESQGNPEKPAKMIMYNVFAIFFILFIRPPAGQRLNYKIVWAIPQHKQ